jgi:large subunit ribosomal protein L14e
MKNVIGRVCLKIAGREAGKISVIVDKDKKNENFVIIDGDVKKRRCNFSHLKHLATVIKVSSKDDSKKIIDSLIKAGYKIEKDQKPKKVRKKPKSKKPVKKPRKSSKKPKNKKSSKKPKATKKKQKAKKSQKEK